MVMLVYRRVYIYILYDMYVCVLFTSYTWDALVTPSKLIHQMVEHPADQGLQPWALGLFFPERYDMAVDSHFIILILCTCV